MPMYTTCDYRIATVLDKIEKDPMTNIASLRELVNLSSSRLTHLFKSETGVSLRTYLNKSRMERAARLLRSMAEVEVKKIAHSLGYHHETSFNRAFQKNFQCTPTHYRNNAPTH